MRTLIGAVLVTALAACVSRGESVPHDPIIDTGARLTAVTLTPTFAGPKTTIPARRAF